MPRNSSGTYSLPAGNPVVSGDVITTSWANTTLSDIGTALTGSLARNGDGGMTGQLKADAGTVSAPGISWSAETTSGWYRIGTNQFGFSVSGTLSLSVASTRAWTFATPSSGTTVTINHGATTPGLSLSNGSGSLEFQAGGGSSIINTPGAWGLSLQTNSTTRLGLTSTGNVTVAAPTSGVTVDATAVAGANFAFRATSQSGSGNYAGISLFASGVREYGILAYTTDGGLYFQDITAGAARGVISSTGNWQINAPSSGYTLDVAGVANTTMARFKAASGWGGVSVGGGTSDWLLLADNASSGTFSLYGGSSPSSVIDVSSGRNVTINPPSLSLIHI